MATPTWQPSTFYSPGSLVQPATGQVAVPTPIPNWSFESGNTDWILDANLAIGAFGNAFGPGTQSLQADAGWTGDRYAEMQDFVDCIPGESINATCQVQQGASDRGNAGAQIYLRFYDSGNALIQEFPGNLMEDSAGGAWHPSSVTASAPAGTAFVRIAVRMRRVQQNLPFWVDSFTWNKITQAQSGLIFKAVQANIGLSGSVEPVWPTVNGVQVVDNEVTWEAILATRIVWEAHPILVSGATEPPFVAQEGAAVGDNTISWRAVSRRVTDTNCPRGKIAVIAASKIFKADDDIVAYSATVNPLDWSTANDAGYLPSNLQQYGANPVAGLGLYRSNLVVMNTQGSQVWQVDEDPAQMALLDAFPVGTAHHDAIAPAFNDLFFLASLGVRTVGIAGGSTNLASGDAGMPIDPLVQDALRVAKAVNKLPMATYFPAAGQYWLMFPDFPPNDPSISGALPTGIVGGTFAPYAYSIVGGVPPYSVTVISGSLPPGLSISSAGVVTGIPTQGGSFPFELMVTDAFGGTDTLPDVGIVEAMPMFAVRQGPGLGVTSILPSPDGLDWSGLWVDYPGVPISRSFSSDSRTFLASANNLQWTADNGTTFTPATGTIPSSPSEGGWSESTGTLMLAPNARSTNGGNSFATNAIGGGLALNMAGTWYSYDGWLHSSVDDGATFGAILGPLINLSNAPFFCGWAADGLIMIGSKRTDTLNAGIAEITNVAGPYAYPAMPAGVPAGDCISSIMEGNGVWVAGSQTGALIYRDDDGVWQDADYNMGNTVRKIVHNGAFFVAISGESGGGIPGRIATSVNGANWVERLSSPLSNPELWAQICCKRST